MKFREYDIKPYDNNCLVPVVKLLYYLWGRSLDENLTFFKWKYEENPLTENPLGVIVLYNGEVVGFKSFYPSLWETGGKSGRIHMLSPTDTVVHPDHRRKGLFTAMTKLSLEMFENTNYRVFINLSANQKATSGNMKLDWHPIERRTYLRHFSLIGLIDYLLIKTGRRRPVSQDIHYGRFGNIEVSRVPEAKQLSALIRQQEVQQRKFRMLQQETYLEYRLNHPKQHYIYFYLWHENSIVGYVIIKPLETSNNVHIIDYGRSEQNALKILLTYIIEKKYFKMISIWNNNIGKDVFQLLKKLKFRTSPLFEKIEDRVRGPHYLLARPIKKEPVLEEDWFIDNIDLRKVENWTFKEFCADPD
ncbi:MAG: GNAT family N-acetyltransferase [Deltaproteobacteria bacterium]|nr:GNAT family N-acetyltransferase [Deltaproteobacteria bacterium]